MNDLSSSFSTDSDNMKTILNLISDNHKGFQVCFFNSRSLNLSKRDYINFIFESTHIDLICVVETWFQEDIDDQIVSLNDFKLIRNDRKTGLRGGGVAIYYKNYLNCKIIYKSDDNSAVEFLLTEISDNRQRCLVACVYNPSRSFDLINFFQTLQEYCSQYENIILCGDLNIDLLENERKSMELTDNLASVGLFVVNKYATRFGPNSKPSLLDVTCVVDMKNVNHFEQLSLPGVSDHDMLFLSYNIEFNATKTESFTTFRDFKRVDFVQLTTEAALLPWHDCFAITDINDKLQHFTMLINYLYDKYIPLKRIKIKNTSQPWFNSEVLNAIKTRGKKYSRWKRNPSNDNWEAYRLARNNASNITKVAKTSYFQTKLNPQLSSKKLWSNIKSLGISQSKNPECRINAKTMNEFFLKSNCQANSSTFCLNENLLYRSQDLFCFEMASNEDIIKCLLDIKSNAIGEDGVSLKFLKLILPHIVSTLTHIVNYILMVRTFPKLWKVANVIPVAKKKYAIEPADFRPISILPALSKVFEKFLANQILNHLRRHKLLTDFQSGFRKNHSCATAMVKILEDIRKKFDNGELTILVLLDFSKAFDSLDLEVLLTKLKNYYGFNSDAIALLRSYLNDRSQRVTLNGSSSNLGLIKSGVPQGSILGPILFSIFINDIVYCCQDVLIHLYADDAQVYLSRPIGLSEDLILRINDDLERIFQWAVTNKLKLNADKTQALAISHQLYDLQSLPAICVNNVAVKYESSVTSLGFKLNSQLNCRDHINSTICRMYAVIRRLWASSKFLSSDVKLQLVKSLVVPVMSYGSPVYSKLDSASVQKLQLVVNNAARYIFLLRKHDHISNYSRKIFDCSVSTYFDILNVSFLQKLIYSQCPGYLYSILRFARSFRTFNLIVDTSKYIVSSRMFFISAVKLWNSLPINIKSIRNNKLFKLAVRRFLV